MKTKEPRYGGLTERGLKLLARELGPMEMVEFLRHIESAKGDYTRDRHKWLDTVSLNEAFGYSLRRQREKKTAARPSKRKKTG